MSPLEVTANPSHADLELYLNPVRLLMRQAIEQSTLCSLLNDAENVLGGGRMLRARLTLRVGLALETPPQHIHAAAAAIELVHAASLLHDDVIDGGAIRRHAPAFWVQRGAAGAILLGDFLLVRALDFLLRSKAPHLLSDVVRLAGTMCEGEAAQEIFHRGRPSDWSASLAVARQKTGALFAFAARAGAPCVDDQAEALEEAGFLVGTAYQISDDFLDAKGSHTADKSLGRDRARHKSTTATAIDAPAEPAAYVAQLSTASLRPLERWPNLHSAWRTYLVEDVAPALNRPCLGGMPERE